ncbi:JAB domain-containing protein [uncultured Umboniibacter sp.]|uniref:JAB domain-containing protein n=1 Tax=uncultured Umboniibacter sp. TaxID=1798917 RepID=UPI00262D384B|nr:JAB domain-containing protein [uncultured Umboniibacter sp.]
MFTVVEKPAHSALSSLDLQSEEVNDAIVDQAKTIMANRFQPGRHIQSPSDAKDFLRIELGDSDIEVMGMLVLSNANNVLGIETLATGTIDRCTVYPKEIARTLLLKYPRANALCLFHNHPSGSIEPSDADQRFTQLVIEVCNLLDVRVLDHFIITSRDVFSFAEEGLI